MRTIKIITIVITTALITCLTSCVTTKTANLTLSENNKLELYTSIIPDRNYTEIAYIEASGGVFHTPQNLLNGLIKKSIELNADALINIKYDFQCLNPIASGTAINYTEK
ncbi:MAG: hypothetical protein PHP52_02565 [Bacteroidales bacterium]|nr:hypothetical protein [Bacteroidales bacterium]MDD4216476.1 hypothetical protein [Bacteroidales bacterium]MDY0141806.1 hypothetical protein [Bacteroidales bacterium]